MANLSIIKTIFLLLLVSFLNAQPLLVINELDCDTPGLDDKEFVELRSSTPYFPLDGYVVVFFNCSPNAGNASYLALDLDGYSTDINGLFLIGSTTVIPSPQYIIPINVIQNGQDALAIYRADAEDFPEGRFPYVDDTLVDVLVYGTNDPEATSALEIFRAFRPGIQQINEGPGNNPNSIQRDNNGNYFVALPTPGRQNDGSGITLNGLTAAFDKAVYNEGDTMRISFTTENVVAKDLSIRCVFNNVPSSSQNVTGNLLPTIRSGEKNVTTEIVLNDDNINNSDIDLFLSVEVQDSTILILVNSIKVRVNDNDYKIANFGTPIRPTYNRVQKQIPSGYYDALIGKSGNELRTTLQNIIAHPQVVRAQTYNDCIGILREADQNPENSNQVWQVYLEVPRSKIDFQEGSSNLNVWNREHVWPRSKGGFFSIKEDENIDGKNIFWPTNADSLRHGNSDAHALRAVDGMENGRRGNSNYGEYTGPASTAGGFRGDVSRSIFFMGIRYNGLEVVEGFPTEVGKFGDLNTLLTWHRQDPPDDFEANRNNVVYDWQKNRNPFIDMPELVEYIWGDKTNQVWEGPSSVDHLESFSIQVYPNPNNQQIFITCQKAALHAYIYDVHGKVWVEQSFDYNTTITHDWPQGNYFVKISDGNTSVIKHIVVVK